MQVSLSDGEQVSAIRAISEAAFDAAAWIPALEWKLEVDSRAALMRKLAAFIPPQTAGTL